MIGPSCRLSPLLNREVEVASSPTSTPWLQTTNRVLVAIGLALSTSCLAMRIHTKIVIMKKFWWDDVCIIIAWMFSVGTQALILYGSARAGIGYHIVDLSPATIQTLIKVILAAAVIYIPYLAFAKLALLMLYYRLLGPFQAWIYTIYVVAFIISGYSIALILALIFACDPIQKGWDITITGGSCISRPGIYLATAITNTVSDLVLILIPVKIVWGLRIRLLAKLGVLFMFGIGCLTIITSILRLATLWPLVTSRDISYKMALAGLFIIIEANFIILCGSLPYLRQFVRHYAANRLPGRWIKRHLPGSTFSSTPNDRDARYEDFCRRLDEEEL